MQGEKGNTAVTVPPALGSCGGTGCSTLCCGMATRKPKLRGEGGCLYPPRRNQFSNKNLKVGMQFLKSGQALPWTTQVKRVH